MVNSTDTLPSLPENGEVTEPGSGRKRQPHDLDAHSKKLASILYIYCPSPRCTFRKTGDEARHLILSHYAQNHKSEPEPTEKELEPRLSKYDDVIYCQEPGCPIKRSGKNRFNHMKTHYNLKHPDKEMPSYGRVLKRAKKAVKVKHEISDESDEDSAVASLTSHEDVLGEVVGDDDDLRSESNDMDTSSSPSLAFMKRSQNKRQIIIRQPMNLKRQQAQPKVSTAKFNGPYKHLDSDDETENGHIL